MFSVYGPHFPASSRNGPGTSEVQIVQSKDMTRRKGEYCSFCNTVSNHKWGQSESPWYVLHQDDPYIIKHTERKVYHSICSLENKSAKNTNIHLSC